MTGKRRSSIAIFLICAAIAAVASIASQFAWFESLEMKTVDERFRLRHLLKKKQDLIRVSDQVVLAGVDNQSVEPFSKFSDRWGAGGWFTRDHWINAIPCLVEQYKPSVVAYDILLQPNRTQKRDPSAISESPGKEGESIDRMLRKYKIPFREIILEKEFPRLEMLDLVEKASNAKFSNYFYDIEEARLDGKAMPHFIAAYNFTWHDVNSASVWKPSEKVDEEEIKHLQKQTIPSLWI